MSSDLEDKLGYKFKDINLLKCALTHKSVSRSNNYEHLEFLGDHVLGLVISSKLYRKYPNYTVGQLSCHYNNCVNESCLVEIAYGLGLVDKIQATRDIINGKKMNSITADVCEAIFGAIFLDSGYDSIRRVIENLWKDKINCPSLSQSDPKSVLQEWMQENKLGLPVYNLVEIKGEDHDPIFVVELSIKGFDPVYGSGPRKQMAEFNAARSFLDIFGKDLIKREK